MPPRRAVAVASSALLLLAAQACGLTVTNERPSYDELQPAEKDVVQTVLAELTGFDAQLRARTGDTIASVLNPERIDVAFRGLIFTGNVGDGVVHVSTWENLTDEQRNRVKEWFAQPTLEGARQTYARFFYRFLAVSQGAKQFMYEVLTPAWLYEHRSLFSMERDSVRTTMAYYAAVGRQNEMWPFVTSACAPILAKQGPVYGPHFDKTYLIDHFHELANPRDPTGYMYFLCRWIGQGVLEAGDLSNELNWLKHDLPRLP
ncbi:MAG: hypothetical protein IT371_11505 [Deltaproteobacteria bacterium]|nr:hypothetical protein [Deltaproteobacteria bacterium]